VARSPLSRFSESLRAVKTAVSLADTTQPIRCLGVTSALPGDGKSSCASNLAMLYAMCGMRTLVIDADIYHSALTSKLLISAPGADSRKNDSGSDSAMLQIKSDPAQGFDILPSSISDARHLLAPHNMQALLPDLHSYDMVLVDLPPLTAGADRLAISSLLDGVILVAQWGQTPVDLVAELSRALQANKTFIVGVLLTKVGVMSTRRYRALGAHAPS